MIFKTLPTTVYFVFQVIGAPFLDEAEDVGLPNSCTIVVLGLDEIPLTSGGDSPMFHSPTIEVSPFHVIFNLNGVLITTCFEKGGYGKATFHTIVLRPRLEELLEISFAQFHIYIWSKAQHHNIYNYLDQI